MLVKVFKETYPKTYKLFEDWNECPLPPNEDINLSDVISFIRDVSRVVTVTFNSDLNLITEMKADLEKITLEASLDQMEKIL